MALNDQLEDDVLDPIVENLQDGKAHSPYLFLSKGVLCFHACRGYIPKVVLLNKLVPVVFKYFHVSPVGSLKFH